MPKASDLITQRPFLDVLIYGGSGSGKTTWAARSPVPFVVLTEAHGLQSIATVNPDAHVELCTSFEEVSAVVKALKQGAPCTIGDQPGFQFELNGETITCQTVIFDSLTDIQELLKTYISKGSENLTLQEWGRVNSWMQALLQDLRSLPVNFIALCLESDKQDDQDVRIVRPLIQGRSGKLIGQWFSIVGYAMRRTAKDSNGIRHVVAWQLGGGYLTKKPPTWPIYTVSNIMQGGAGTLGSIHLAYAGPAVPHNPGDSPDGVELEDATVAVVGGSVVLSNTDIKPEPKASEEAPSASNGTPKKPRRKARRSSNNPPNQQA